MYLNFRNLYKQRALAIFALVARIEKYGTDLSLLAPPAQMKYGLVANVKVNLFQDLVTKGPTIQSPAMFNILDFPEELRLMIFRHVLASPSSIVTLARPLEDRPQYYTRPYKICS